jgi:acyl carrier protein
MDKKEFLAYFAESFEDTDPNEIQFDTRFRDLEEWSSLIGMTVLAMAKVNYNRTISGEELKRCTTVEDVYNLINNK